MIWDKIKLFLPIVLGALGGFLYYNFVGCNVGIHPFGRSCAITGSPVNSTLYGSLIGLVLSDWKQIKSLFINPSSINSDGKGKEK
jgi:hypothetical protein